MDEKQIYELFKEKGAILEGHFLLSSGLHSPMYLQCAKLLQYPDIAGELCNQLAGNFKSRKEINFQRDKENIDVVIAPAVGGIIVGYEIARALKIRAIFAERVEGKMTLRRGFELRKGENVLAVEDVVTTGGSLSEIIQLVEEKGGNVEGIGMLVDRSGGQAQFDVNPVRKELSNGVKKIALLTIEIKNYPKESCPLCEEGIPLVYLGSRPASQNKAAGRHKKID